MNYSDPSEMWEDFVEYAKDVKENPRYRIEYVGKDGDKVRTPLERPLTIEGFTTFVWNKRNFGIDDYMRERDERYKPFSRIITRVREEIRMDQLEGGMVGQYNSNLTARINGLTDKKEHEVKTEQPLFGNPTKTS